MIMSNSSDQFDDSGSEANLQPGEDVLLRARRAREMVMDLEQFLRLALANPASEKNRLQWPLRYNSAGRVNVNAKLTEE